MKKKHPSSERWTLDFLDCAILVYLIAIVIAIPHTNAEEIFQVNSIYDHLYLKNKIHYYDYIILDVSSLIIATLFFPFKLITETFGFTPFSMLIIGRSILHIFRAIYSSFGIGTYEFRCFKKTTISDIGEI